MKTQHNPQLIAPAPQLPPEPELPPPATQLNRSKKQVQKQSTSKSTTSRGYIYVATIPSRGTKMKWTVPMDIKAINVNVTSSQRKDSENRVAFSPMQPIAGGYRGFWNFESYWQSGKVFRDIPFKKTYTWWKNNRQPKRRSKTCF